MHVHLACRSDESNRTQTTSTGIVQYACPFILAHHVIAWQAHVFALLSVETFRTPTFYRRGFFLQWYRHFFCIIHIHRYSVTIWLTCYGLYFNEKCCTFVQRSYFLMNAPRLRPRILFCHVVWCFISVVLTWTLKKPDSNPSLTSVGILKINQKAIPRLSFLNL